MKRLVALLSLALLTAGTTVYAVGYPTKLGKAGAQKAPFKFAGQLFFESGRDDFIGTGVVVRKKSILTAGHNLYDPYNGWSTDLLFRRGAHGNTVRSQHTGDRVFLLGGYREAVTRYGSSSSRSFASDMGGIRFSSDVAEGKSAAWIAEPALLTNTGRYMMALGYAAEGKNTGDFPMFVIPDRAFSSAWGSFYESRGAYFEGGMSGGPVFVSGNDGRLYVSAIVVSGSRFPFARGGIRVIDAAAAGFIWNYLR